MSRVEYLQHGRFSSYQIYDGGRTWEGLCTAAGVATLKVEPVPDEVYFERLKEAVAELGRLPKTSERKRFGLNFSKRRYPTLRAFIEHAACLGVVALAGTGQAEVESLNGTSPDSSQAAASRHSADPSVASSPVPAIPQQTRRTKWERTRIDGFPYAPQGELGVVALLGILCTTGKVGLADS